MTAAMRLASASIVLPPGYKEWSFLPAPENPSSTPSRPVRFPPGAAEVVESNYERIRRLLDKTTIENKALIQALKRTRKEQEDILAKLAIASAGGWCWDERLASPVQEADGG